MSIFRGSSGQIMAEVFVALGLLVAGAFAIGGMATSIKLLNKYGTDGLRAAFLAQEGLEAARSIRDGNFELLTDGAYGIATSSARWVFSGASDSQSGFTRVVTVAAINERQKKITSVVTWPKSSVSVSTILGDIGQDIGQAKSLSVNMSATVYDTGNKTLKNFKIINTSTSTITIATVTAWWSGVGLVSDVKLGTIVWKGNDQYVPASDQPSGVLLDIDDVALSGGQSIDDTWFKFNGDANADGFIIRFTFSDNTSAYIIINPP